jgi:hypothetical protein
MASHLSGPTSSAAQTELSGASSMDPHCDPIADQNGGYACGPAWQLDHAA